jgi:hypothetical protein
MTAASIDPSQTSFVLAPASERPSSLHPGLAAQLQASAAHTHSPQLGGVPRQLHCRTKYYTPSRPLRPLPVNIASFIQGVVPVRRAVHIMNTTAPDPVRAF